MKKFILNKETGELIPWSEFVHEKADDSADTHEKEAQLEQKTDNIVNKEESKDVLTEEISKQAVIPQTIKEGDKLEQKTGVENIVVKKTDTTDLGPPGDRPHVKKVKKRTVKRHKESQDTDLQPIVKKKKVWLTL